MAPDSPFADPPPRTDPNARKTEPGTDLRVKYPALTAAVEASPKRQRQAAYRGFDEDYTEQGYTEAELRLAFAATVPDDNWKERINTSLPALNADEEALIFTALIYYCGSPAEFIRTPDGITFVIAAGYYECIGA